MASLWDKARKELDDNDDTLFNLGRNDKRQILQDILKVVQGQQDRCLQDRWKIEGLNGKQIVVRDVCAKMVSSIERYMAVVDVAVQYDPIHSALPWAGIRFFLQLSINDSKTFDAMIEGLEILSRVVARYSIFETLYLGSTTPAQVQLKDHLVRLYAAVLSYLCKARKYYNRSITKRIVVNTFRPPELDKALTVISEEEASVRRQADLIDTERQAEGMLLIKDVGATAKQVELRVADLLDSQQKLEAQLKKLEAPFIRTFSQMTSLHNSLERAERIELLLWLSKVPYREHHRVISSQIFCGSGQWLLRSQNFISWMTSSASEILWLHGTSGSGKTKLVAILLENLRGGTSNLKNAAPIAYFYCSRALAEPERADPCEILRSIIKQLSQSQSGILRPTVDSFEQKRLEAESDGLPPSTLMLSECTDLLLQLVNATPATIVIDALDECDPTQRHDLLSFLNNIITTSQNVVKIFVTSRDETDIRAHLAHCDQIRITEEQNRHDIQQFVVTEVDRAIKNRRLLCGNVSHDLREHIVNELILKAQGMFRWVSLQVEALCDPEQVIREQDVVQTLTKLPLTLSKSYDVILGRILRLSAESRTIAVTTLQWLLAAEKMLSVEEFQAILSGSGALTISPDDVTGCCCGLVDVDKGMDTLRLTHPSVREYLEALPQFSKNEISSVIAERCLAANINHCGTIPDKLADYAAVHWALHCAAANESSHLNGILSEFLFNRGHFDHWLDILESKITNVDINSDLEKKLHAVQSIPTSPLFVLSCFGLFRLLDETQLEISISNWHHCNLSGASALYLAARWGHLDAVKYLVRLGLNVNHIGGHFGHALQASAFAGHRQIVAFLMENGATMTGPRESFDPVYAAISSGNGDIASMILEKGYKFSSQQKFEECLNLVAFKGHADLMLSMLQGVNSVFSPKQTHDVLQVALYGRNEQQVNVLLVGYGDINAQIGYFGNALHAAICGGSLKLVERVLTQEADLHTRGRFGHPLRAAVAFGHEEVVRWLLTDKRLDPNIQDEELGDCLQTAASKGYLAIMTLLLEQGADVKGSGGVYQNALQAACFEGHSGAVQILLQNHASIHSQGRYRNALQAAVYGASKNVVEILLEHGADWDLSLRNIWMQTTPTPGRLLLPDPWFEGWSNQAGPLEAAVLEGNVSLVRFLLGKGIRVDCESWHGGEPGYGGCGYTALQVAARHGHAKLVDCLLDAGADLDMSSRCFASALHAAIQGSNFSLALKFLQKGAKIDKFWGPRYGNCLQICSDQGDLTGVKFLIDNGANVNGPHGLNGTALQLSSDGGHLEIVQLLILHDADLEAHGGLGTALQAAAARGHLDVVRLLIENGAKVNTKHGPNGSALHAASADTRDKVDIVQVLLEAGAHVNDLDAEFRTPLYLAAYHGNNAVAEKLLNQGADILPRSSLENPRNPKSNVGHRGSNHNEEPHNLVSPWTSFPNANFQSHTKIVSPIVWASPAHMPPDYWERIETAYSDDVTSPEDLVVRANFQDHIEEAHSNDWALPRVPFQPPSFQGHAEIAHSHNTTSSKIPIAAAISQGHAKIAHLLFKKDPKHYLDLGCLQSDLGHASREQHTDVENMLLEIQMLRACEWGNVPLLRKLLDKGLDVNTCIVGSQTLLDVAALAGHILVVQTLLDHGFDQGGLNQSCQVVIRALSGQVTFDGFFNHKYVEKSSYIEILELFMTLDQNLKIESELEEPLNRAIAKFGHTETLVLLPQSWLACPERQGRALQSIVTFGKSNPHCLSMIQHILSLECTGDEYVVKYGDALVAAVRRGSPEILGMLMSAPSSTKTLGRLTHRLLSSVLEPLREAYAVKLEKVLSRRDDHDFGWRLPEDVLHRRNLAREDFPKTTIDMLHLLLDTLEDIREETVQTVFEQAVQTNHLQSAKAILHHAAKQYQHGQFRIEDPDRLLLYSVQTFLDDRMTDLLLAEGANPNATTLGGLSALHLSLIKYPYIWLSVSGDADTVCFYDVENLPVDRIVGSINCLLQNGANINAAHPIVGTPLQLAIKLRCHSAIVQALVVAGADMSGQVVCHGTILTENIVNKESRPCLKSGHSMVDRMEVLLEHGAQVNASGGYFGNALQAAAYVGSMEGVQLLLQKGADVNARGGRYGSALQAAKVAGRTKITEALVDAGAQELD